MWSMTLAVDLDERRGVFTPSVKLVGRHGFHTGLVRIEIVDDGGGLHHVAVQGIKPRDIGEARLRGLAMPALRTISFPPFPTPDGATAGDVLGWAWEVAVVLDGFERVRWRRRFEHICTTINPEGEIELGGPGEHQPAKIDDESGWGPESGWTPQEADYLLDVLVRKGILSPGGRHRLGAFHLASSGMPLVRVLVDAGVLDEEGLLRLYGEATGTEFVRLADCDVDPASIHRLPEMIGRRLGLFVVGPRRGMLTVATSNPLDFEGMLLLHASIVEFACFVVTTQAEIEAAWDRFGRRSARTQTQSAAGGS